MKPAPVLHDVVDGWPVYTARRPGESVEGWRARHCLGCAAHALTSERQAWIARAATPPATHPR